MARPASRRQQLLACWPLETSLVTWTFGGDTTVLADYALTTTTTTIAVKGCHDEHLNIVYIMHDHTSLQWSRPIASETVRLVDVYVKHAMFHFLCVTRYDRVLLVLAAEGIKTSRTHVKCILYCAETTSSRATAHNFFEVLCTDRMVRTYDV